jgi:hypothetical protein
MVEQLLVNSSDSTAITFAVFVELELKKTRLSKTIKPGKKLESAIFSFYSGYGLM